MRTKGTPSKPVLRPRYDGGSLPNLAVSIARAAGLPDRTDGPPLAPPLRPDLDPFRGERAEGSVVLLTVDGFGAGDLARWAGSGSPTGRLWHAATAPLTTVFPSTTTAALTSLSSGVPPGRHGLVGYRQYLPRFGTVADLLKMSTSGWPGQDLLVGPRWVPSDVTGAPTLFQRGLRGVALTRDRFQTTGFTRLLYEGATFVGYATATDMAHELLRILEAPRPPPVVYAYWDELDTIHHLKGPTTRLANLELERVAQTVSFVARGLSPRRRSRVRLIVTGDHGQVPSTRAARIALESIPDLLPLLTRPLAGDRRAGFVAVRPGSVPEATRILHRVLPAGHRVVPMRRAIRDGLFGPPPHHPELEVRLGDLLVLVPSPHGLTYLAPGAAPPTRYLQGAHGGLEVEEMQVPRVAGTFAELATPETPRPQI